MSTDDSKRELQAAAASLGEAVTLRIARLFAPDERAAAILLLASECGEELPLVAGDVQTMERVRLACLKISDGALEKLGDAVSLANTDWRDVLVAAGFADDPTAHRRWMP
jgi:hypothetical protein